MTVTLTALLAASAAAPAPDVAVDGLCFFFTIALILICVGTVVLHRITSSKAN